MKFDVINAVTVSLDFGAGATRVGRLAVRARQIYFEYNIDFIAQGLEISPLRLPLRAGLQTFEPALFESLPGVFNDSLPDGWGRLLFDRALRANGILPEQVSPLDRLAHVGAQGMGALIYEPDHAPATPPSDIDLDRLADQALEVFEGQADDVIAELIALNGSSAGARPKAMIGFNPQTGAMMYGVSPLPEGFEHWLVKFPNNQDGKDGGAIEYVYALMAQAAGVTMTDTRLITTERGAYFATRRLHAHTASGLLHADHRIPSLDYETLVALTQRVTRDVREIESLFRLATFNVLAHNRDDHAKNFTYLMNDQGEWRLAPAYDLTFSSGPGGEQTTTVANEGKAPTTAHLVRLGEAAGLQKAWIQNVITQRPQAVCQGFSGLC
ncbi:type II toxin-antitoxin system HipA family toxin [Brevundimonas sp.]|uniref:type II toxin-antitoxin system HipA family toxin n=1 Tax=Brevundimonas sp. TaxID=1871086 RepID=UPI0028AA4880|nr:type II toxin-antitoxin system HipA family toxin [Brevundimonas sp.]